MAEGSIECVANTNGVTATGQVPRWSVHVQTQEEPMEWEPEDPMRELTSQFSMLTLDDETPNGGRLAGVQYLAQGNSSGARHQNSNMY